MSEMYIIKVGNEFLSDYHKDGDYWEMTDGWDFSCSWDSYEAAREVAGTLDNAKILKVVLQEVWSNEDLPSTAP